MTHSCGFGMVGNGNVKLAVARGQLFRKGIVAATTEECDRFHAALVKKCSRTILVLGALT